MANLPLLYLVLLSISAAGVSSRNTPYSPPNVKRLTDLFRRLTIDQGFNTYYGGQHVKQFKNGSFATLSLDKDSGCGLASKNKYLYGFFSAAIKLPSGLSPGVVFAFYLSNAETYPHNHDEIDFEILGHDRKNDWNLQTNVYANGSVNTGREEKFNFWFDPTQDYHNYSIIWNSHHIVFLVDSVPVREYKYQSAYPLKPMNVYATIWDGSEWATHGGKYPVNYKYAPFVVSIGDAELAGCIPNPASGSCSKGTGTSPSSLDPVDGSEFASLSNEQSLAMDWARRKLMFYSYCSDKPRHYERGICEP
ncbi:Probable xyloglucan endotransglucosylase/hydrolase protein 33 [Linum perenne]